MFFPLPFPLIFKCAFIPPIIETGKVFGIGIYGYRQIIHCTSKSHITPVVIFPHFNPGLKRNREFTLGKAEFHERIHWREIDTKYNVELDEILRRLYRN